MHRQFCLQMTRVPQVWDITPARRSVYVSHEVVSAEESYWVTANKNYLHNYLCVTLRLTWKDRAKKTEVRKTANMKDIVEVTYSLRWKLGCHVARMEQRRWAQAATVWDVRISKRKTGRPKTRWADTLKRVAGGQWSWAAKNGSEWNKLSHCL